MATKQQLNANRENAEKSTGPKSTEGKETSSQNATKHGLTARYDVIRSESQEDFDQYRKEMIEEFNPIGLMQHRLADRIISLSWRLKRAEQIHNKTIDAMLIINDDSWTAVLKVVRGGHRETFPHLDLGRMAIIDFTEDRVLDKLIMYERRIENSLYKTMKELKNLKKEKSINHPRPQAESTTQYEIRNTKYENMQNEPNSTPHTPKNPINHSRPQADSTNNQSSIINNQLKGPYPPQQTTNQPRPKAESTNNQSSIINNQLKGSISNRNQGRSEAYNHPRRPLRARLNKK
jgi:hypothetical protein